MARYGAVDVGSNSIRMQVAEVRAGGIPTILAEDREVTRLGEGVFRTGSFTPDAMEASCATLLRMGETLGKLDVAGVRAVATAAARDASNQRVFLDLAATALGHPIEVISGQEEARLIHVGVQSRWPHPAEKILIIDIGGGSAELIFSEAGQIREAFSRKLGAVRMTEMFLKSDPPDPAEIDNLDDFIEEKLGPIAAQMAGFAPERVIATAATAAASVSMAHQLPKEKRDLADQLGVTTAQLREMSDRLGGLGLEQRRQLPGVGPRRAEVIVAGCRVLTRIAELLSLPGLCYSAAGVRDGVIADLAARGIGQHESRLDGDQRNVVREMARRYNVAAGHAEQVAAMGRTLFESLEGVHKLPPKLGRLLEAACYLHDIGHFVSDTKHHRHSQYIVANSDLPGFTDRERLFVASLCRYHRKSLPVPGHEGLKGLNSSERGDLLALVPLLRLADSLDRGHAQRVKNVRAAVDNGAISLLLEGSGDTDLEAWAAQRTGDDFRQVFGAKLIVRNQADVE